MIRQKIAIIVGHTSNGDKGAYSPHLKLTEYDYNIMVAQALKQLYPAYYDIYTHTEQQYYKRQLVLANKLNPLNYEYAIELHFNSHNTDAQGCEMLYFHSSVKGKELATRLSKGISEDFAIINRGAKPAYTKSDRGYWFLKNLRAIAVVAEPFFGSNKDSIKFLNPLQYATSLHRHLQGRG